MEIKKIMSITKIATFVILTVFVMSSASWSTTYYVDATNGNDENTGTSIYNAWKKIAKVNYTHFMPGDSILFKRGETWREMLVIQSSGSVANHIIIGAYGTGDRPIIKGSNLVTVWTIHNENIWKATLQTEPSFNQVFFDGIRGNKQTLLVNLNNEKDWYWSSNTLYIYSVSNPEIAYENSGIEVSVRDQCIKIDDRGYITIQDFHLSQGILTAIVVWDRRECSIKRILAEKSYNANIITGDGSVTISNCEVRFSDTGHGVYLSENTVNSIIEYCHCHHNRIEGIQINPEDAGDEKTYGIIIRYNNIHNNRNGMGLHATNESEIYGNILYNNSRAGISFYDHSGGPGFGCTNNTVYNNTILVPITNDRAACGISARRYSTSNKYQNNIIYVLDPFMPNWYIDSNSNYGQIIDHNCSFRVSGTNIGYVGGENKTWVEWRALNYDTNGINENPLFIDSQPKTDTDFILQSISPCKNMGTNVGWNKDYFGKPLFQFPDIKCYNGSFFFNV